MCLHLHAHRTVQTRMLSGPGPQAGHLPQVYAGLEMSCCQRKRARLYMRRRAFLARVRGSTDCGGGIARSVFSGVSGLGGRGVLGGQPSGWACSLRASRWWSQAHALGEALPLAVRNAPSPEFPWRADLLPCRRLSAS
jgi:hypothetical protein